MSDTDKKVIVSGYRRFKVINTTTLAQFESLCDKKKLTREDLILILTTISLRTDICKKLEN